jgi:hypothetical protein
VGKLDAFASESAFTVIGAPVVSDEATLVRALAGCDAVVALLISTHDLKATDLVSSLVTSCAANEVRRLVFTASEVTAVLEEGEHHTLRQRLMLAVIPLLMRITPYSMADMLKASVLVTRQTDWDWTIVRAPSLRDTPPVGYRFGKVSEITSADTLSRTDYARCLLDSVGESAHHGRILAVKSAFSPQAKDASDRHGRSRT